MHKILRWYFLEAYPSVATLCRRERTLIYASLFDIRSRESALIPKAIIDLKGREIAVDITSNSVAEIKVRMPSNDSTKIYRFYDNEASELIVSGAHPEAGTITHIQAGLRDYKFLREARWALMSYSDALELAGV